MKLIIILLTILLEINLCFGNEIMPGLYNRMDTCSINVSPYYWCLVRNDTIWITSFAGEINTYHIEMGILDTGIIRFSKIEHTPGYMDDYYWMDTLVVGDDKICVLFNQNNYQEVSYDYDSSSTILELCYKVKIHYYRTWSFLGKHLMRISFIRNLKRVKYKEITRRDVYRTVEDSTLENNRVIKQIFSTFCGYQSNDSTHVYK